MYFFFIFIYKINTNFISKHFLKNNAILRSFVTNYTNNATFYCSVGNRCTWYAPWLTMLLPLASGRTCNSRHHARAALKSL